MMILLVYNGCRALFSVRRDWYDENVKNHVTSTAQERAEVLCLKRT